MLHELLFALSGHDSPLLSDGDDKLPHVSPAERGLLRELNRTAKLHKAVKAHLSNIALSHQSMICRVVCNTIASVYLARFQESILDFEQRVLVKDSATVGAYNIVPLSSIVNHFQGWDRTLQWLWNLSCFMSPPETSPLESNPQPQCTGVSLLDRLRDSTKTGYPDVEELARSLTRVAERAWIRQLSHWLLLFHPPGHARHDFFIQESIGVDGTSPKYVADLDMIPAFLTSEAASSILFMGTILQSIRTEQKSGFEISSTSSVEPAFVPNELRPLTVLASPLSAAAMSAEISHLRNILSERLVNKVLPASKILHTLQHLFAFFLAGRGDFTDTLIEEADKHLETRRSQIMGTRSESSTDIASAMMKSSELATILGRCWASMAPSLSKDRAFDDSLEWAREHLKLDIASEAVKDHFSDFLVHIPVVLTPNLKHPINLAITSNDIQAYSTISSYLLAIRRAHVHLTSLWKQGSFWKTRATRHGTANRRSQPKASSQIRLTSGDRVAFMRSIWVCSSNCVVFLAELGDYFTAEVTSSAWKRFHEWTSSFMNSSSDVSRPSTAASTCEATRMTGQSLQASQVSVESSHIQEYKRTLNKGQPLDPELLSQAHHVYLTSLAEDLLLTNASFGESLRSLLTHVDQIVALVLRLQAVQKNIDLHEEGVVENGSASYAKEEQDIKDQLQQAETALNNGLRSIIEELKKVDGLGAASRNTRLPDHGAGTVFTPWRSGGVDRLLIRLDSGIVNQTHDDS